MSWGRPTLGYWNIRGLGQPIRYLLHYLEVDFEDKQYDETKSEVWFAEKEKLGLLFPNLPYLMDGESKVTESNAILKHLCRKRRPELLGKTEEVKQRIDMLEYFMYDIAMLGIGTVAYQYTEERRKRWVEEDEPRKLRYLTEFINDNQWTTGSDITWVDFFAYEVIYHMTVFNPNGLDNFPKIREYMHRFEELPAIKKFMNSDSFIKAPCFGSASIYKM